VVSETDGGTKGIQIAKLIIRRRHFLGVVSVEAGRDTGLRRNVSLVEVVVSSPAVCVDESCAGLETGHEGGVHPAKTPGNTVQDNGVQVGGVFIGDGVGDGAADGETGDDDLLPALSAEVGGLAETLEDVVRELDVRGCLRFEVPVYNRAVAGTCDSTVSATILTSESAKAGTNR
jgi:hypothetical protein